MSMAATSMRRASATERAAEYERVHQDHLFVTPPDLECPISHDLFVDPVINCVGQVYERHAIEQHLKYSDKDPSTRAVLPNKTLTPVYILRSRAQEYRECSARACIEAASSPACEEPAQYLRRGAELCALLPAPVQGLSPACLAYVQAHPSNAYNENSLRLFARGLLDAGYRDRAATVYYSLLLSGADRAQQAELLQNCLECWQGGDAAPAGKNREADARTFAKLAEFVATQRTFTWPQIIEIVQLADLGEAFTLRLCEQLLAAEQLQDGAEGDKCGILLQYVKITCKQLQERVEALEAAAGEQSGSRGGKGTAKGGGSVRKGKPRWLNNRALASTALLVTTLAHSQGPLLQFARIASLLCILQQ